MGPLLIPQAAQQVEEHPEERAQRQLEEYQQTGVAPAAFAGPPAALLPPPAPAFVVPAGYQQIIRRDGTYYYKLTNDRVSSLIDSAGNEVESPLRERILDTIRQRRAAAARAPSARVPPAAQRRSRNGAGFSGGLYYGQTSRAPRGLIGAQRGGNFFGDLINSIF